MTARLPILLACAALLAACAHRSPGSDDTFLGRRPEITVHAPLERVRVSLATQEKGEGLLLTGQSADRLVFVAQVAYPAINVSTDLRPAGAPYIRSTYLLAAEGGDTRVSVDNEVVRDYGTDAERARPFDTRALRQVQQRGLLRLRAIVEKDAPLANSPRS